MQQLRKQLFIAKPGRRFPAFLLMHQSSATTCKAVNDKKKQSILHKIGTHEVRKSHEDLDP
jgi:hypothetical protein